MLAGAAVVAALAACGKEAPKPEPAPLEVTTLAVQARDVPVAVEYVAQTQSSQAVNIQARVSGFLDKRVYTEGAFVKAGQVLFRMDPKPFQAQVDGAAAALQRNQAALDVASANLKRTKPLVEQNALSQKDLDDATGQYEQAAAAVAQSKAQLQSAQLDLSYTTITSPVDGISSYAAIADGTYLSPQNSQLTTVSVLSPMWINFSISENQIQRITNEVKQGLLKLPADLQMTVEIEQVDGSLYPHTGRITFADPSYNPQTGTFLIRATVDNPKGVLRPNQFVRARLRGAVRPNAILVPQRAVQQGGQGHFAWVVNKDGKAERRPVVVGDWYGDNWFINEGLRSGDQVAVDGVQRLSDGAPVKVKGQIELALDTTRPAALAAPAPASGASALAVAAATAAAATAPAPPPLSPPGTAAHAVHFASGRATLDASARQELERAAAALAGGNGAIIITGYADRHGAAGANVELAKQRAIAVRDALAAAGVAAGRLMLKPPVEVTGSGSDEQARRVDIAPGA